MEFGLMLGVQNRTNSKLHRQFDALEKLVTMKTRYKKKFYGTQKKRAGLDTSLVNSVRSGDTVIIEIH